MAPIDTEEGIQQIHKPMSLIQKELPGQLPGPQHHHGLDIFISPEFRNQLPHINI
jgi:hypothetical protein